MKLSTDLKFVRGYLGVALDNTRDELQRKLNEGPGDNPQSNVRRGQEPAEYRSVGYLKGRCNGLRDALAEIDTLLDRKG